MSAYYPYADDNRGGRARFTSGDDVTVPENTPTTTPIYTAQAHLVRHPHRHLHYALQAGVGDNDLFSINATTGVVTFKTSPDFEGPHGNDYMIVVTAYGAGRAARASQVVHINVTDVNDNAPVFTSGTTASEVEHTPASSVVYTAHATDADGTSPNNTVTYSLSGTDAGQFNINASTGAVTFKSSPDYAAPTDANHDNVYNVTVTATDGGTPALSTSEAVAITVTDAPPSTPVDADSATANRVAEGAAAGTYTGLTASATDGGSTVTYSLTADSSNGGFAVNATTGVVTVADPTKIDYETAPGHAYSVTVAASDGTLTSSQTFSIGVTDVAPSIPVDSNAAANTVAEGTAAGTTVGITASSSDVNGPAVTYSLTADSSNGGFTVNASTGVVTVADPTKVDYESAPGHAYSVTVAASDGTLTSSQTFSIGVTDVAPSTPVDSNAATNTVAEGAAAGTTVGLTVSSTDPNGPAVTYSLTADSSNGGFTVNASTGVVTVADPTKIDYESAPGHAYSVTVAASDGTLTSSQTFSIGVTDVAPSTPVDNDAAANTVVEGAAAGTTVGLTASSTDPNGPAVTYSLTADSSNGGFTVNATTGVVTVADPTKIDYETAPGHAYSVTVAASDGTLTSSQTFSIGVTDVVPSIPVDSNAAANTVAEGAAVGTTVGITASSSDVNGPAVTYSLTSDSSNGGFAIDATTGVVTVADPTKIDYETAPGHAYSVTVAASDGTLTSSQTFSIGVTDVAPSTPVDSNSAANSVAEGAAVGTTVGITASSTDPNGPAVTYSLTSDSSNGGFTINASTGVITVADPTKLDYETSGAGHAYSVTVAASDGTLTSSQTFSIGVTDVAPSTPVDADTATTNSVVEGAASGTYTGLTASSTDINGPAVTYSLTADSSNGGFAVNATTGVVTVADPTKIDYESAPGHAYSVTVAASDGTLTSSQTFSIGVTDVAPSTPVDSNAAANTVAEGAAVGTTVGLTASSTDINGPAVTYSLTADSSNGGFTVDASTGVVTVADPTKIDYESAPGHAYSVTVAASDGTLTSSQTFSIGVTDVAPSAPVDSNSAANAVVEGAAAGTTVGLTAASTDPNGPAVTYSLTADSSNGGFAIDATTGVVTVADPTKIDYESAPGHAYSVTVAASDGTLTSSQSFSIAVTDAPPSTPVDSDNAANQVSTNAPQGSSTGLTASSTDVNGGTVTYSLTNDDGGHFQIDPTTGVVTVGAVAPVYDSMDTANDTRTIVVQAADSSGMASTQSFTIGIVPNTPPVANDDATSATEAGGTNNGTAGSNPSGNVVLGTGGHGEVADTDQQDPSSALVVVAVHTGAEGSSGETAGTVGSALAGQYGSLTLNSDGSYTYVVDNSNATVNALNPTQTLTDTFNYTIQDTGGLQDTATITVTIHGANDAPTAHPDAVSATEAGGVANGTAGVNPTFNVIAGTGETIGTGADTDPDNGDTLTVVGVVAGSTTGTVTTGAGSDIAGTYGTIHINADGSSTYTVNQASANSLAAGQSATDTFSYTVQDSGGLDSTTQVTVTVHGANDAPTAVADTSASPGATAATEAGGTNNGTPGANGTGNVLTNDTDPDQGDTLTVQGVEAGNHTGDTVSGNVGSGVAGQYGTITVGASGAYTYVVDNSNATVDALNVGQHVTDTFTYTIHDGGGLASTSTVSVTINGADDAPIAVADGSSASPIAVTSGMQATTNLLANDTDVDTPIANLTAVKDSDGSHGTVVVNSNGTFTYTANAGFYGTDSFTYHANDGTYNSNTATVTVSVTPNVAYINNNYTATRSGSVGSFTNPYSSIAAFNADNDATHNYSIVYVEKGTGTYTSTTGITLLSGQTLEGQGVDPSYFNSSTGQTTVLHDLDNTSGSVPTITITGGTNAVTLSTGNTIAGLNIATTGAVNGITDNGGSVGTFTLQGVGISTVNGTGLSLAHGGTFAAGATTTTSTDTSTYGNTISTTGTGTALSVISTNIGSTSATFQSISATGSSGNAGIVLQGTGTAGGLHVTGTGTAGSGGTISSKTGGDIVSTNATTHAVTVSGTGGTGIFLSGTSDVQLNDVQLGNFSNYAIYGNNVTGFQLANSTINGTNGNNSALNHEEGSVRFDNLYTSATFGTASITNSNISGGESSNVFVSNTSGTLNRLTMTGDTIGTNDLTNTNVNGTVYNNVYLAAYNAGTTANLTFGGDGSGQGNTITGSKGALLETFAGSGASTDVVVRHDTFQNMAVTTPGLDYGGVYLRTGGTSASTSLTFDISHNSWTGVQLTNDAFAVQTATQLASQNGTMTGTINANTITGGANPANASGDEPTNAVNSAIDVQQYGAGTSTVLVSNNTVSNFDTGVLAQNNTGNATLNLSIFGNTFTKPDTTESVAAAIYIDNGQEGSGDTNTTNVVIGSATTAANKNTIDDPTNDIANNGIADFGIDNATTAHLNLSQGGSTSNNVTTILNADNQHGSGQSGTFTVDSSGSNGSATVVSSSPPLPPAVAPMLAAGGGVAAAVATPGVTALTQAQLDVTVHAAIADWIAAGATAAQVAALEAATYQVADLPTGVLGREGPGLVQISSDAAGYGWYVDPTPSDNSEFAYTANGAGTDLYADPTSAAAGHMDLLTTVLHEMGHVLDLADSSLPSDSSDLMYVDLVQGERRLPDIQDVADSLGWSASVVTSRIAISDEATATSLHLHAIPKGATATVERLPGDATITLADGAALHDGETLTAHQLASLKLAPQDLGASSMDYFTFAVTDGGTTTLHALDIMVGHGSGMNLVGSSAADHIVGSAGADVIAGEGGHDILTGGGGADHFVFDQASLASATAAQPHIARITDYSAAKGAVIDLSSLFSASQATQPVGTLAQVVTDGAGNHAVLEVNTGSATAPHWVDLVRLHGVHAGDVVDVTTDAAHAVTHLHAGIIS